MMPVSRESKIGIEIAADFSAHAERIVFVLRAHCAGRISQLTDAPQVIAGVVIGSRVSAADPLFPFGKETFGHCRAHALLRQGEQRIGGTDAGTYYYTRDHL